MALAAGTLGHRPLELTHSPLPPCPSTKASMLKVPSKNDYRLRPCRRRTTARPHAGFCSAGSTFQCTGGERSRGVKVKTPSEETKQLLHTDTHADTGHAGPAHRGLARGRSPPRPTPCWERGPCPLQADPGRARPFLPSLSRACYARRRLVPALRLRVREARKRFPRSAPARLLPEVGVNSAEKTQIKAALRYLTTPQTSLKRRSRPTLAPPVARKAPARAQLAQPGAGQTGGSGHPVPGRVLHRGTREVWGLRVPRAGRAGRGTGSGPFPRERRSPLPAKV